VLDVLSANRVEWNNEIEFVYAPARQTSELPLSSGDLFLTTSWWTTRGVKDSVPPDQIVYLLQEDERMFYAFNDERLRCEEVLLLPEIKFLINTELLYNI
jgi:hypothetical protein